MTLRTEVFLSTPAVVLFLSCRSGSPDAAPLISRLWLATLPPRYSVSCKLVEYSLRRGRLRKFFHENNDGSLSLSGFAARAARNGRRYLRVRRYVTTRIANMDTTIIAIYACVSRMPLGMVVQGVLAWNARTTTNVLLSFALFSNAPSRLCRAGNNIVLTATMRQRQLSTSHPEMTPTRLFGI